MLAHGYFGAAKPRCCGYTTQRFRWPKRASMAETGITCDYPFIKMGCHQRAICTLTLLAEQFRTQAAYFGVVLMEKRTCGSCGRKGQRSGQSYGRLLCLTHGAIKSIPPTRPAGDMQTYSKPVSIFYSNTAKPSRRAARRLASSRRRVWSSCVKVTLEKRRSAIGLAHEDPHKALLGCCCRRSAADKDNQRRFSCLGTLLFHRNLI